MVNKDFLTAPIPPSRSKTHEIIIQLRMFDDYGGARYNQPMANGNK